MTDGDLLRLLARRLSEGYSTIAPTRMVETRAGRETTDELLRRLAGRLDAWDKELMHQAIENDDS